MLMRTLALAVGLTLSISSLLAQAADTLKVSAIPDEAPTELLRKFKPLGAYLEQQLGMKVEFVPVSDYPAVVEALATDRIDLAWLGGFTFVQARLKTGNAIPLVQREQDAQFTSKFITADPAVKSLADLKGKTFAFGSVSSTSGSLMPRYFMLKDGIKPETWFPLARSIPTKSKCSPPRPPISITTGPCAAPSTRRWPRKSRQRFWPSIRQNRRTRPFSTCRPPAVSSKPARITTRASRKPRALPTCSNDLAADPGQPDPYQWRPRAA